MNKELRLLTAIGWVKDEYIQEMMEPGRTRVSRKKVWLVAALVAMALLLTGCAAVIFMSLESQTVHQEIRKDDAMEPTRMETLISLQGIAGSPQFQAAQEWADFVRAYDPDSKIIQSTPSEEMDQGEEYYSYNCYTPEMARKIDEICEKYGLEKQGKPQLEQSWENVCRVLNSDIVKESPNVKFRWASGYIYRSGTFNMDGELEFVSGETEGFQLRCTSKKDFDTVFMNIGDPEQYEQWTATTADGSEVLLARSPEVALILADRDGFFTAMNISSYEYDVSKEELEEIAGLLNLSFRLHPISVEDWEYLGTHEKESNYKAPTPEVFEGGSYSDQVQILLNGFPQAKDWGYTMMDVDGDGSQDLVVGKDGLVRSIYTTDGENTYITPFSYYAFKLRESAFCDPIEFFAMVPSYGYVCEGHQALYVNELEDGTTVYQIAGVVEGKLDWTDILIEDPAQNAYYRSPVGRGNYKKSPITNEQFDEALNACVPIPLDMKPLTEFPLA